MGWDLHIRRRGKVGRNGGGPIRGGKRAADEFEGQRFPRGQGDRAAPRAVEGGRQPITRGLVPSARELLIRETILGLKKGKLDAERLREKFGVDPLEAFAPQWQSLEAEGCLERVEPAPILTRRGLLMVDALLPRFFDAPS